MKGNSSILKLSAIAIVIFLLIASAGYANIKIENVMGAGDDTRGLWEDHFTDASKIDPSPPGQGKSDNYTVSSSKVKMINTYPAWADPSWTKMRTITVTNNVGQVLSNYALKMTINYDSDMQSDYDDLRFKHTNNPETYLAYWIESYNSTAAKVWINIPSLPIGSSTVYMFYGNPSATSESNIGSVFSNWDDQWSDDEKITNHAIDEKTADPDVCSNGNNEFLVCWEEGQKYLPPLNLGFKVEIRASIYGTNGAKLVYDKRVFSDVDEFPWTYFRNENPSIAYGGGKWLVVWEHYDPQMLPPYDPDEYSEDIKARFVQRNGNELQLGSVIDVCTAGQCQADANVVFDSVNNRFLITWEDGRAGDQNYNIYGRLYDTSGNPVQGEKTISAATNNQCEPWAAFDPVHERFLIAYEDGETSMNGPFDIYVSLFDENVNIIGSPQKLADGNNDVDYNFPCTCYNSETNEYLVTWDEDDISEGEWWGNIWGRILDSSGSTVVNNFKISDGYFARTDIVTFPISNMDNPYFVTYEDHDNFKIRGKFVTADGDPSSIAVQLSISTDPLMEADWASMDIGSGKIFVAWEDTREVYPDPYNLYPDVFGNLWTFETQFGLSVSYSVGSEQNPVLLGHVTSVAIQKGTSDYWNQFSAIGTGSTISYSILDGATGDVIISSIIPGDPLDDVTAPSIRLMATFSRPNPSYTPELDYWSISYTTNSPPNTPIYSDPTNGETGVDIYADLFWNCTDPNGDPLTYDVYLGTSNPPPLISPGQSANTYNPTEPFNYGITYYWKIVAFDDHQASTPGPVWSFTSWSNTPPNTPIYSDPTNGETDVDANANLYWNCTDPDGNPLTYNVYFDTLNPPTNLASNNQTGNTFDPQTLDFGTTYYWMIIAYDNYGGSATGPVWSFTTFENDPPNTPTTPEGPGNRGIGETGSYCTSGTDPNGDQVQYRFDWDDGTYSGWTELVNSGTQKCVSHFWTDEGTYVVKSQARDEYGSESGWSDGKTVIVANQPPNTPSNPTPENEETNVPVDITLSWVGGDQNPSDTVTYDLYFENVNPPGPWKLGLTLTHYDVLGMEYGITYYWKIVAKDNHGGITEGPIWHFTTKSNANRPPGVPGIDGPGHVLSVNENYEFKFSSVDRDGDQVSYYIDWGDGTNSGWTGYTPSGQIIALHHTWTKAWTYCVIKAKAKDTYNEESPEKEWNLFITKSKSLQTNRGFLYYVVQNLLEHRSILLLLLQKISINPMFTRLLLNQ
jgi:hypothetical protein